MFYTIVLSLILFLLCYLLKRRFDKYKWPPGPIGIPLFGSIPCYTTRSCSKLRDRYGHLVTQRIPGMSFVQCFNYNLAKQIFLTSNAVERSDLMVKFNLDQTDDVGVAFNNGPNWLHGRTFILHQFRSLGSASSKLDAALEVEAKSMVEYMRQRTGKPMHFPMVFKSCVLNVLWQFVAGRRYPLEESEVSHLFSMAEEVKKYAVTAGVLSDIFPVLNLLPEKLQDLLLHKKVLQNFVSLMKDLIEKTVSEHKEDLDVDNPRDLIDEYLKEMKEENSTMRIEGLYQILYDLFNAGTDTVYHMLEWTVYFMALHPDVAAKCQAEIDEVTAHCDMVSLSHRSQLLYVDAFVLEALRVSSVVAFMHRQLVSDTSIVGFHLPKGTIFNISIHSIHRDEEYWSEPHLFRPERFIDFDGNLKTKTTGFFPFGVGKRNCIGDVLARTEMFLFVANLMKHFNVSVPEGEVLKEGARETYGLRSPKEQLFVYSERSGINEIHGN